LSFSTRKQPLHIKIIVMAEASPVRSSNDRI
jgi:hypothetical protein